MLRAQLKKIACDVIDKAANDLNEISQEIWSHPELNFEERHAHKIQTDFLEKYGFPVERHHIVETGFRSDIGGASHPNIAVLCEFDALPEIGHACGHNLIAEAGIGAAIGIKAALDAAKKDGQDLGKLSLLGTPAEEGGGGKLDFIKAGAFNDVDAAMMVHPSTFDGSRCEVLAIDKVKVKYIGKASHASAFPWEGINALDAAVMAYTSVSVMRQQMKPDWRVHGVILNGGVKPNVIPEETLLEYYLRAPTLKELRILKDKFINCCHAAATSTGCQIEFVWDEKPYDNVLSNLLMANIFEENIKEFQPTFGETFPCPKGSLGSTDMGNVSYVVPSIHSFFYIPAKGANHTRVFTDAAGDADAQPYTLNQAKAMAMTAIDIYCQPHLLNDIAAEFTKATEE